MHPKAHVLCPFTQLETTHPLFAWGWCYPLPSFPMPPTYSHQLNSLLTVSSSWLWAFSLRKSSRHTWKIKCKSFSPHPETKHPFLCCHKQANMKSLSGKLSEVINWWWKHYAADLIWWWCKQGCPVYKCFCLQRTDSPMSLPKKKKKMYRSSSETVPRIHASV